jgi:hypothetical protein
MIQRALVEFLDDADVKPDIWTTRGFQSEVWFVLP